MSDGLDDATFRRCQASLTEMNAVAPPQGLRSVHVGAVVVDKVALRGVRNPCLGQRLDGYQDL